MKQITELLAKFREQKIRLILKENNLEIVSYGNAIDPVLIQEIKFRKEEIITYLKRNDGHMSTPSIPTIELGKEGYAVSNAQHRLWLASQHGEGSIAYNTPNSISIDGNYDPDSFLRAIHAVIDRHEILRTVFKLDEVGRVRQFVLTPGEVNFSIDYHDYRGVENAEVLCETYIKADSCQPFDLAKGPLLRAALLQLADNRYQFYYNMHHIIGDGISMEVLSRDVMAFHDTFKGRGGNYMPPLRIQYKDYAAWQLDQLGSPAFERHKAYWVSQFSEEVSPIELPTLRQRGRAKTYRGKRMAVRISPELTFKLRHFTSARGGSLFMGLLAIWKILLYRYTGQTDITVGNPVTGRNHPDLEDQIGFYINMLALRTRLDPDQTFTEFLDTVKANVLLALEHQAYPFDQLVDDLELARDIRRHPLFDMKIDYHGSAEAGITFDDQSVLQDLGDSMVKFDLEIDATEVADGIDLVFKYNCDVYEHQIIAGFAMHYNSLLQAVLASPQTSIGETIYLFPEEQAQLTDQFGQNSVHVPDNKTIIDLFLAHAQSKPEATAVVFGADRMTYQELDKKSNRLAHCLIHEKGLKPGGCVGIYLDMGIDYIVCILGILRAGGIYVPIDTRYPTERKRYLIENASIECLVTDSAYMFDIAFHEREIIAVDLELDVFGNDTLPINKVDVAGIAYILHTSGSTGTPKGVMVTHDNVMDYLAGLVQVLQLDAIAYTYGLMSTPTADLGNTVLFGALATGGTLHTFTREMLLDVFALSAYFKTNDIDIIKIVPSHWYSLCSGDTLFLPKKAVVFGGERLTTAVIDKIEDSNALVSVYNHYGPTETTIGKLLHRVDFGREYFEIPVGKPFSNAEIYILDKRMNLLPIGVTGDLYIGGRGLSPGYLNSIDLTAKKFIPHPFESRKKVYATGDLARWTPNGDVEFLGRADDQVKIRGYRVEVKEIEYVLNSIDEIQQAVVVACADSQGLKQLVAYLVSTVEFDVANIQAILRQNLPEYMVPWFYVRLEKIPLTGNGKIDYRALPPVAEDKQGNQLYLAPQTLEERALVAVWESVLQKERVGVMDNFYHLGGDSIKSLQVVARLRQYGFVLKVGDLLATPILKEMSSLVKNVKQSIDQAEVTGEVLLTPVQRSFFNSPQIPNPHHFNQSILLKSGIALDTALLNSSVSKLVKHHDALRMIYSREDGQWRQFNRQHSDACYRIEFYDLSSKESPLLSLEQSCQAIQSGFDLEKGPLLVIGHFRLADGDRIALICHHLVVDGVSWRIIMDDLAALYAQHQQGKEIPLPQKTDSFQKWAEMQYEYAQSPRLKKERAYWEGVLNQPLPEFPGLFGQQNGVRQLNKRVSFSLDREITSSLQTKVHEVYNTEINDVLLTALGLSLHETFGVSKSLLKMEGHGREDIIEGIDISRTVGWFTSHYPVVLEVLVAQDTVSSLAKVKDDLRKVPHKGIGYGIIKYLADGFVDEPNQSIKFNYLGNFDNNTSFNEDAPLFEYGSEHIGNGKDVNNGDEVLLDVLGLIVSGKLVVTVSYDTESYRNETIQLMIDSFQSHLTELVRQLAAVKERRVTPTDLTYSKLTLDELGQLNADNTLEDIYPLSPAQEGLYYHWLSSNDPLLYLTQLTYRIKAATLKPEHLKRAYEKLVARHAVLRTSFTSQFEDTFLQIVRKDVVPKFSYQRCPEGLNSAKREAWIDGRKLSEKQKGFDLTDSSQMRLNVLDLGDELYEFIWCYHHVIIDGWCTSILINDYYKILQSIGSEVASELPAPKPFSNYIQWLGRVDEEGSLSYWKNYLSGYDRVMEIPFKIGSSGDLGFKNQIEKIEISGDIYQKVDSLCNENGVTHYTFLQTVWGYLLASYNGVRDVVFGSIVSGRPADLDGVEDMVGLFMNTIPVRITYDLGDKVADLLKRSQSDSIEGLPHHYVSLAKVQGQSKLGVSLINHVIVFENYPIQELLEEQFLEGNGPRDNVLHLESMDLGKVQMNYDFSILVKVASGSMAIYLSYNENEYPKEEIRRLGGHFHNAIDSFTSNQYLADIDYLSETERHELLEAYNATTVDYPLDETVVDIWIKQVHATPDATALVFNQEILTYKQLDEKSSQVARYLLDLGVSPETIVPICLERSPEMIIGILGILKAGGAYVPVDPAYPKLRVNFIMLDTGAQLVLTSKKLSERFESGCLHVLCLDALPTSASEAASGPFIGLAESTKLAYLIYTSGSSGSPKGVKIEHRALLNFLLSMRGHLGFDAHLKLLSLTTFTFDISILEFFSPLLTGGQLILVEDADCKNPDHLNQIIAEKQPTCIQATPSTWQMLINENWRAHKSTMLLSGGELITSELKELLVSRSNNVWNLYGPTETTIWSTLQKLEKDQSVSVGRPIANTQVYILDEYMSLIPRGITGEICISGFGLSRGYLNRSELTGEKFVEHPFRRGERLYRTGDLGRWLPDGSLDCLGRKDSQVKVRGYRIELGEIESVLSVKEGVKSAVVLVRDTTYGEKELVAYFTSSAPVTLSDLHKHVQQYLPPYMVPAHFIAIADFPVTSNGKVDRKALKELDKSQVIGSGKFVAARNEMDQKLIAIWENVLGKEKVGIKDDFFELGGHSLKVIRLVNHYHRIFEAKINISDVFANRTLESHAGLISAAAAVHHLLIPQATAGPAYPISDAQRRLWVLSQFKGGSASYNMPASIYLDDTYDVHIFKMAIQSVLNRHEVLRTVFREDADGTICQVVLPLEQLGFEVDSQDYSKNAQPEQCANDYIHADSYKPFDLIAGPLLRMSLLKIAQAKYILYYNMHHIISDGWSLEVLSKDVLAYYHHYVAGTALNLPELRIQYKDYASWQLSQLDTPEYKNHKEYWTAKLSGNLPLIDLPTFKPRPSIRTYEGRSLSMCFSQADSNAIRHYVKENDGTLFTFLFSALKVLLYRYTGEEDLIVGSPIVGRNHPDLEQQIGFYANTLPIRTSVKGSMSFREFHHKVKNELLEAYNHQMYPVDRLVEELNLRRDTSRNALFDVLMVLQNASGEEGQIVDTGLIKDNGEVKSRFDLELNFKEVGNILRFSLIYNTDVYDYETITTFVSHYQRLVQLSILDQERCIGELNYLWDYERNELLNDYNDTQVAYSDDKTVVSLFQDQVERTPEDIALVFEGQCWSYREVDTLSNQLAHVLRCKDVKGICVASMLKRSIWSVISMIAIMKAGKIYVPIDLDLPSDRIAFMLKDAEITHVVGELHGELGKALEAQGYDIIDPNKLTSLVDAAPINCSSITENAFVIYTSGSTGAPKGVVQTHKMLRNLIIWDTTVAGIHRNLKYLQYSAFGFDFSLQDVYTVLSSGGQLHLTSEALKLDFVALRKYIIHESINVLGLPYAAMTGIFSINKAKDFEGNRIVQIISTGEHLKFTDGLIDFLTQYPSVELHNFYGPSETHVVTSYKYHSTNDPHRDRKDVLIGKPISNTSAYIVNGFCQLQPKGVFGEVYIAGSGLASGYMNREELTMTRFIPDPFNAEGVVYKTGDIARWLPDGNIEYVGRTDDQVKIRGYRVELGEVESILDQQKGVKQSVVLAREDGKGGKELVAYVVSHEAINQEVIQDCLYKKLPNYMVPRLYVILKEMPLTPNGKIDKKALPDLAGNGYYRREYTAPTTEMQIRLTGIWQDVLGVEEISIKDNFFDLGGNSLDVIKISSKIKKQLGIEIDIQTLFQFNTVAELAFQIEFSLSQKAIKGGGGTLNEIKI